jgi:hypothetical protein
MQERVAAMLRAYLPSEVWFTASLSGVTLSPGVAAAAKRAGMSRGAPDLSFVWPDGETTYCEIKAEDGTLSVEQKFLALRLGECMAVCRSWAEVRAALEPWLDRYGLRWLTDTESVRREADRRAAEEGEKIRKARPMRKLVAK